MPTVVCMRIVCAPTEHFTSVRHGQRVTKTIGAATKETDFETHSKSFVWLLLFSCSQAELCVQQNEHCYCDSCDELLCGSDSQFSAAHVDSIHFSRRSVDSVRLRHYFHFAHLFDRNVKSYVSVIFSSAFFPPKRN